MQFQMLVKCGLTSPHRATGEIFVSASLQGHFDFYDPSFLSKGVNKLTAQAIAEPVYEKYFC